MFEDALKRAGIDLHIGDELKVKVVKKGNHVGLVISSPTPFEYEILKRSSRVASPLKRYRPNLSLGERIRGLRKMAGLSLRELAKITGISKGSLGSIENDERAAGLNVLKRIAGALKVDIAVLVSVD